MGRLVSVTAFGAAALAFLLPFGLVTSCDGGEVRFTGVELATRTVPLRTDTTEDRVLRDELEANAGPIALGLLVALFCGLVLSAIGALGAAGVFAAASVVLAQILLYAIVLTGDGSDLFVGCLLTFVSVAAAAVVALVREARSRRRASRSRSPLIAYSVAVVLPPLGAIVAVLGWLVVTAVRLTRRRLVARASA